MSVADAFAAAHLSVADREALLAEQDECTIAWNNADGWPVAVVQTYVWHDGSVWITAFSDKPRVAAWRADPRAVVTVTSKGTEQGRERMVSCRVVPRIHPIDDPEVTWFPIAFGARTSPDPAAQAGMAKALTRQDRVVVEMRPVSWNSFDGVALVAAMTRPRQER